MRLKVTVAVLNLFNVHNLGNSLFIHYWKVHTTCDLNFIVKVEGYPRNGAC